MLVPVKKESIICKRKYSKLMAIQDEFLAMGLKYAEWMDFTHKDTHSAACAMRHSIKITRNPIRVSTNMGHVYLERTDIDD